MIDTLKISCYIPGLSRGQFTDAKTSTRSGSTSVRWVLNQEGMALTYFPASCILIAESSIGVWSMVAWLITFGGLPPIGTWRVMRVDYYVDVQVGDHLGAYVSGLSLINLSKHERSTFASGVVWKASARWIKFYDKGVQGGAAPGTLRFEVSTLGRGIAALEAAFGVDELSVMDVLDPDRGLYVIMLWLDKLGLLGSAWVGEADVLFKLHKLVGVSQAAAAFHALRCITTYGTAAYASHGLLSASTYYKYKRILTDAGLLYGDEQQSIHLPSLAKIIVNTYINKRENLKLRDSKPQNVQTGLGGRVFSPKNFSEKISDQLERLTVYVDTVSDLDSEVEGNSR